MDFGAVCRSGLLNTELDTILELRLVSQMETPGLGARIEEDWFLSQFKDRLFVYNPMSESDVSKKYDFIAETQTPKDDSELRGVTGATITSGAVLQMLKDEITYIYNAFEREEQLDKETDIYDGSVHGKLRLAPDFRICSAWR